MHYYEVAPNKIVRSDSDFFTYSSEEKISIGQIVFVEVGKKKTIGIVIKDAKKPEYPTKPIISKINNQPIPIQLVKLAVWISEYYLTPLATVLQTMLPRGVEKTRRGELKYPKTNERKRTNFLFNNDQLACLKELEKHKSGTFLLQGVTGSGKTEVYIEIAKRAINNQKSVIVLVPEIALTPQLLAEFSNHFSNLLVTHSKMTESQRHQVWMELLNCNEPRIVIGPRSALFMPLSDIGAIIIDEAHEPSYKQEKSPKYSALRVATVLGKLHESVVIFGSATPNIVDRFLAEQSKRPILKLEKVARKNSVPPEVEIINMTKNINFSKHRFLSNQMLENIQNTLNSNNQVLIFHNRRGSANITQCKNCGWSAVCDNCFVPMSLHNDNYKLICHICSQQKAVPTCCPNCHDSNIIHKGVGTKLIEYEINKLFPNACVARFDNDNKFDETLAERYQDLYDGKINIIIGTQVIAKGLDLPKLRMVGIIQADSGLTLPDYNSNERAFQLIAQVVGRVGRNEHKTKVIVQTYKPDHKSIIYGLKQDYETFYKDALEERKRANFPPYSHLLQITCAFKTEATAIKNSKKMASLIRKEFSQDIEILGPLPSFYERINGKYHWQIILKSKNRGYLIKILKSLPKNNWQFELDPASLLK